MQNTGIPARVGLYAVVEITKLARALRWAHPKSADIIGRIDDNAGARPGLAVLSQ